MIGGAFDQLFIRRVRVPEADQSVRGPDVQVQGKPVWVRLRTGGGAVGYLAGSEGAVRATETRMELAATDLLIPVQVTNLEHLWFSGDRDLSFEILTEM
jgi:hypothetical protein